jgi:wobble nucleotide-excising tRNase
MMIKKIKTINNLAVFDNFEWDGCVQSSNGQPLLFEKVNILYGRNYSGKTTLSRILRTLETHRLPEKYENPQFEIVLDDGSQITQTTIDSATIDVRVFNEDFVRANLRFLIDPDGEIVPFAILGANNAETEKAIRDLETEIGSNTEGQETGLHRQLKDNKTIEWKAKTAYDSANRALENKISDKAINRQTGIKYNPNRFGDQNYTSAKIKQDIDIVIAQSYLNLTAEKKAEHEDIIREQTKPPISPIPDPGLKIETYFEKVSELLSREIGSSNKIAELLRDAALNEWVKKGKSLLDGKDICAFCGNPISKARWEEINAHFDEESKKLEAEIDDLLSEINSDREQLQTPLSIDKTAFYAKYVSDVNDFIRTESKAIQDYCSALDSIGGQLQARRAQITITAQLNKPSDNSTTVKKPMSTG